MTFPPPLQLGLFLEAVLRAELLLLRGMGGGGRCQAVGTRGCARGFSRGPERVLSSLEAPHPHLQHLPDPFGNQGYGCFPTSLHLPGATALGTTALKEAQPCHFHGLCGTVRRQGQLSPCLTHQTSQDARLHLT